MSYRKLILSLFALALILIALSIFPQSDVNLEEKVDETKSDDDSVVFNSPIDGISLLYEPSEFGDRYIYTLSQLYRLHLEMPEDNSHPRVVLYSGGELVNGVVLFEERSWPCVHEDGFIPWWDTEGNIRIYIKYHCGEAIFDRIVIIDLDKGLGDESDIFVASIEELKLLSTPPDYDGYFDGNYVKTPTNVVAWLDSNRLIVRVLNYATDGEEFFSKRTKFLNESLYIFNINDKSKELIRYSEEPLEEDFYLNIK